MNEIYDETVHGVELKEGAHGSRSDDHEEDHAQRAQGTAHNFVEQFQRHAAGDEGFNEQRIGAGHGSGFGGSAYAGIDEAEYNDGNHDSVLGAPQSAEASLPRAFFVNDAVALSSADDVRGYHERQADEQAGKDARNEEVGNGNHATRAVEYERNRRRNHDAEYAAGGIYGCGKSSGILFLFHGGNHESADSGGSSRSGTA